MADRTFTVSVPMRDGVGLATNVALPASSGTFPAVLLRTPYGKSRADGQQAGLYADAGYALVVQDCRGRYDSEGQWFPVVNEANDGCDTVEWLAAPVLEQDLEVVGPITLHLSAASSAADTDFTGKLVDVHPDGRAMIVADGILRAGHRDPSPLKPDQAYEFQIGMGMTAISFPAGHRIRLEVSSSNFPRYSRNLNTGLDNGTSDQIISARQTVFHQRGKESWLELPVIPA